MNGVCNGTISLAPPPGALGRDKKGQISLNFNYKVFNSKIFKPCLLTNERYITYQTGSFGRLGHAPGLGGGVKNLFFSKFNQGPRTVSYSICPNIDSMWLAYCITDNYSFALK